MGHHCKVVTRAPKLDVGVETASDGWMVHMTKPTLLLDATWIHEETMFVRVTLLHDQVSIVLLIHVFILDRRTTRSQR